MTRAELNDLTFVALDGIQKMAPGHHLAVALVVGAPDELGGVTFDVRGNGDDATTRAILERALETLEQKNQRPAGQA